MFGCGLATTGFDDDDDLGRVGLLVMVVETDVGIVVDDDDGVGRSDEDIAGVD